jgi:CBS-domain-containing membrane protein
VKFGTPLAWPWYTLAGSTVTLLAGLVASIFIDADLPPVQSAADESAHK